MYGFDVRVVTPLSPRERLQMEPFLARHGLTFEGVPDCTVLVEDPEGRLVATGSLDGKIIKMVAVDPQWQEAGLSSTVISRIIEYARGQGMNHLFVFTKPEAARKFAAFGFCELARVAPWVVLMEMGEPGIVAFRDYLRRHRVETAPGSRVGAVVVNCNPFTLGHRYLIETAASQCEQLYVIVVETDLSLFPFRDRIGLVRRGIADLSNVTVIRSGDYAVSRATFPSYFLRGEDARNLAVIQTRVDVTLFADLFAAELGLTVRYVGTEPYCPVTRLYNGTMKEILPGRGIEVHEVLRLGGEEPVSASTVRQAIREDDWDTVRSLVPPTTLTYLLSEEARPVVEHIREVDSRH